MKIQKQANLTDLQRFTYMWGAVCMHTVLLSTEWWKPALSVLRSWLLLLSQGSVDKWKGYAETHHCPGYHDDGGGGNWYASKEKWWQKWGKDSGDVVRVGYAGMMRRVFSLWVKMLIDVNEKRTLTMMLVVYMNTAYAQTCVCFRKWCWAASHLSAD